jgi:transglutaminase-like putative cysteine protease
MSNDQQLISELSISGNFTKSAVYRDPNSSVDYLYAEWLTSTEKPELNLRFHVDLESSEKNEISSTDYQIPATIRKYLESNQWVPADDFKREAEIATHGMESILDKAYGVYSWVIKNTFRDPDVNGCGLGIPGRTLSQQAGGGKCADISAVFVTVARAAGIPARDVYGLRLANPKNGDISSGFHCWAEFYLPGEGWVAVDPADVRKMMLVHDLELEKSAEWKSFFWGSDDLFRVVLEKDARGVEFNPSQEGPALNYFMYPYAEINGQALDYLDAKAFGYSVKFEAD